MLYVVMVIFGITAIANIGVMIAYSATNDPDRSAEAKKAISAMAIINGILTLVLGFMALYYFGQNATYERTYMFVMIHFALFLSLMSAGISAMQKI